MREIDDYRRDSGELDLHFFNNFDANLPGGYRQNFPDSILSLPPRDDRASKKRQSQTANEFFAECRHAMSQVGVSEEQIIEARERYMSLDGRAGQREAEEHFIKLLLPIYIELREIGYYRYPDLTS